MGNGIRVQPASDSDEEWGRGGGGKAGERRRTTAETVADGGSGSKNGSGGGGKIEEAAEAHKPRARRSLKEKKSSKELRFEAHFNLTKERPEVESSHQAPIEPENNLVLLPEDTAALSAMDDMLIEYCSTDSLGDLL
uniref:Uncharacterized protein n=1 Tax=Oryza sativa subsp. japonica TaxID=39947 RepID=Q6Z0R2_ORYSJ|nr:hypothetical protein [Oryza sativa Japonica Group]